MNKKVEIEIEAGHTYTGGDKEGEKYTSVKYGGSTYGGGMPCDNDLEIKSSIEHAKKNIIENGDTPVIKDLRIKLSNFVVESSPKLSECSQKKAIIQINVSADGTWLITSDESMIGVGSGAIGNNGKTLTMEEGLEQMENWLKEDGYTEFEQVVV